MLLFNGLVIDNYPTIPNFNTSNVTIQPDSDVINTVKNPYFNTSNVTIQPSNSVFNKKIWSYFNTSNVTIQLPLKNWNSNDRLISIHLMLLFNQRF